MEKRQIKAHCYWPQEIGASETFGEISLSLATQSVLEQGQITVRSFVMRHKHFLYSKEVTHIHYTEW
jgi:hypothetical protein